MTKRILIDGGFPNQYRVALLNAHNRLDDLEYQTASINQIKGNIYLAKIVRIEPGLQAAFIDYGEEKNGFLPFSEIHSAYFNIPVSDLDQNENELSALQKISPPQNSIDDEKYLPSADLSTSLEEEIDIAKIEKFIDEEKEPEISIESSDDDVEKLHDSDDELPAYKKYKIQEVMKRGQIILVQAQKEERGNKGASFTSFISLAGKYSVLMPNNPGQHGISRKISNSNERKRLRDIISDLVNKNDSGFASIILRTAGMGRTASEIKRDYEYLVNLWNDTRDATLKSKAPALIHIEEGIIQKTIRDIYDNSVSEVVVDGEEAYEEAYSIIKRLLPNDTKKLKKHKSIIPIFSDQGVEEQISNLYQQIFHLPSGGYIVINPTEALTSIDVNSGKSTSEKNIEETAVKTNVEAAKEIARQMKLRDISGLIVIDFIDMDESRNRRIVERSIREYASKDKAKIQIGNISSFGLLELSRQRMRPSFLESHTKMCTHCNGKGIVRDDEANSMVILRTIENEIFSLDSDLVNVYTNPTTALYILNHKRFEVIHVEEKYGVKLNFLIDNEMPSDGFSIEKLSLPALEEEMKKGNNSHKHNDNRKSKENKPKKDNTPKENNTKKEVNIQKENKPQKTTRSRKKWNENHSDKTESEAEINKDNVHSKQSGDAEKTTEKSSKPQKKSRVNTKAKDSEEQINS